MPTNRLHIKTFFEGVPVRNGVTRWDVITRERVGVPPDDANILTAVSFQPGDPGSFYASALRAAAGKDYALDVQWKDTRYGREIVKVSPVEQEEVA